MVALFALCGCGAVGPKCIIFRSNEHLDFDVIIIIMVANARWSTIDYFLDEHMLS